MGSAGRPYLPHSCKRFVHCQSRARSWSLPCIACLVGAACPDPAPTAACGAALWCLLLPPHRLHPAHPGPVLLTGTSCRCRCRRCRCCRCCRRRCRRCCRLHRLAVGLHPFFTWHAPPQFLPCLPVQVRVGRVTTSWPPPGWKTGQPFAAQVIAAGLARQHLPLRMLWSRACCRVGKRPRGGWLRWRQCRIAGSGAAQVARCRGTASLPVLRVLPLRGRTWASTRPAHALERLP